MRPITLAALTSIVSASLAVAAIGATHTEAGWPGDKCGDGTPVKWNCKRGNVCRADGDWGAKGENLKCSDLVVCCREMVTSKAKVPPRCYKSAKSPYSREDCCGILDKDDNGVPECIAGGGSKELP